MTPLGILSKLIKGLTQETSPSQLAGGLALGVMLGLVPKANLTAQLLLVCVMALRVNVPLALAAAGTATVLNPIADQIAHPLGFWLLTSPSLSGIWTCLYNMPIVPWTGFNNTIVLGNLVLGLALFFPLYLAGKKIALIFESRWKEKAVNSEIIKSLKHSWLLEWYFRYK
ncbi:MAG: TIGR03546 family protein [bacterium]